MRIGRYPAIGVLDEDKIAVAGQLVAGIGDDPARDRVDRRAARRGDVDAVIAAATRRNPIAGEDAAAHRPREIAAMRPHR